MSCSVWRRTKAREVHPSSPARVPSPVPRRVVRSLSSNIFIQILTNSRSRGRSPAYSLHWRTLYVEGPVNQSIVHMICPPYLSCHLPCHSTPAMLASLLFPKMTKHVPLKLLFPLPGVLLQVYTQVDSLILFRLLPECHLIRVTSCPLYVTHHSHPILPILLTWFHSSFLSHLSPPVIFYFLCAYFLSPSTGM